MDLDGAIGPIIRSEIRYCYDNIRIISPIYLQCVMPSLYSFVTFWAALRQVYKRKEIVEKRPLKICR